jgi:hypothetical protein
MQLPIIEVVQRRRRKKKEVVALVVTSMSRWCRYISSTPTCSIRQRKKARKFPDVILQQSVVREQYGTGSLVEARVRLVT